MLNDWDQSDPYYKLIGPINPSTPRDLIPLMYMLKKENEWETLGFSFKKDKYGNFKPLKRKGIYLCFRCCRHLDEIEKTAISLGKKCVTNPHSIALFRMFDCNYDDFVNVSESTKEYCEAFLLTYSGQIELARELIDFALSKCKDEGLTILYGRLLGDIKLFKGKNLLPK